MYCSSISAGARKNGAEIICSAAVGENPSRACLFGSIDPKQSVQMERRAVGETRQGIRAESLDYTASTGIELSCRYALLGMEDR